MLFETDSFIDRKDETCDLLNDLSIKSSDNRVVLIYAKSGFGKSAFAKNVIKSAPEFYYPIRVKVLRGEKIRLDDGYFIIRIAEEMDRMAKANGFDTIERFLKLLPSGQLKRAFFSTLLDESSGVSKYSKSIGLFVKRFTNLGQYNKQNLFNSQHPYAAVVLSEYIKHLMKHRRFLINIENIQDIDKVSLSMLTNLLIEVEKQYLLLEYTVSDSFTPVIMLGENFEACNSRISYIELKRLSEEHFNELIEQIGTRIGIANIQAASQLYIKIDGNLRMIRDLEGLYAATNCSSDTIDSVLRSKESIASSCFSLLSMNQKLILCIIAVNRSNIEIDALREIALSEKATDMLMDIQGDVVRLVNLGLISSNDKTVMIAHDSLISVLLSDAKLLQYLFNAYALLDEFYEDKFRMTNSEFCIKMLAELRLQYAPKRLLSILPEIRRIAIRGISGSSCLSILEMVFKQLKDLPDSKTSTQLRLDIVDTLYLIGEPQKALVYLNAIISSTNRAAATRILLLITLDSHIEALRQIEQYTKHAPEGTRFRFVLELYKMVTYAEISDYDKANGLFIKLINDNRNRKFFEYGYLLRNSEIILSYKDSIRYLEESVEFFEKRNQYCRAQTLISLSMNLARIGDLFAAVDKLDKAESIFLNQGAEQHIILNNRAAILIMSGMLNEEASELLKLASLTAIDLFSKLAILSNLIIVLHAMHQTDSMSRYISQIVDCYESEENAVIKSRVLLNVSYCLQGIDPPKAHAYYLLSKQEECQARTTHNADFFVDDDELLMKYGFHVEFLSYWPFLPDETL